jgi:hypothetical protein
MAIKRFQLFLLLCVLTPVSVAQPQAGQTDTGHVGSSQASLPIEEEQLGLWPNTFLKTVLSHDGSHIAFIVPRGSKFVVIADGKESAEYDEIDSDSLQFSASGRVAFVARNGDRHHAVIDGQVGPPFDEIFIKFSPDGNHVAYIVRLGQQQYVIFDTKRGTGYDDVFCLVFSDDSQHLAYVARRGGRNLFVVDGQESTGPSDLNPRNLFHRIKFTSDCQSVFSLASNSQTKTFLFIKDGREVQLDRFTTEKEDSAGVGTVFLARKGPNQFVIVDGREGPEYDKIASITFSPDKKRMAYLAQKGAAYFAVVDGRESHGHTNISFISFSPDGKHVAYSIKKDEKEFVVVDGKEGPKYDRIRSIKFSPDGTRVGYEAGRNDNPGKWFAVIDGQEGPAFDEIAGPYFSLDGQHPMYFGSDEIRIGTRSSGINFKKHVFFMDGQPGSPFEGFVQDFTPLTDNRFIYRVDLIDTKAVRRFIGKFVVLNGQSGPAYRSVFDIFTSPDKSRYAFEAEIDVKQMQLVEEGQTGEPGEVFQAVTPDGKQATYRATTTTSRHMVVDHQAGPACNPLSPPMFSPNSKHVAYLAVIDDKSCMVVDGQAGREYVLILNTVDWSDEIKETLKLSVSPGNDGLFPNRAGANFHPDGSFRYLVVKDEEGIADEQGRIYRITHRFADAP